MRKKKKIIFAICYAFDKRYIFFRDPKISEWREMFVFLPERDDEISTFACNNF